MSSIAGTEDAGPSGLSRVFRRLRLRSPTPGPHLTHYAKPLPSTPATTSQRPTHTAGPALPSLPPYLAHLQDPAPPSSRPTRPKFPQPQHHDDRFRSAAQNGYPSNSGQRLPRPPQLAPESHKYQRSYQKHPDSLRPASIPLCSSSKQAYPWELVPQQKNKHAADHPVSSSSVNGRSYGKENYSPDRRAEPTSQPSAPSSSTITPPRKHAERREAGSSPPAGLLTPGGAQKDPRCTPSPGQCWGITKDGMRCTRKIRAPNAPMTPSTRNQRGAPAPPRASKKGGSASEPLVVHDSDDDSVALPSSAAVRARTTEPTNRSSCDATSDVDHNIDEVYCFQHVAEVNKTKGFYPLTLSSRSKSDDYITFSDWFRTSELTEHTQALLRLCMSRSISDVDRNERGYIYIYELRDRSTATHVCFKVGRTTNVFRRLSQWRSRCQSKDPLLRTFFPSANAQGLISGGNTANTAEVPGVLLSHRWEALVHIELAGVGHRVHETCNDCGARHREMFIIPKKAGTNDASRQVDAFELTQRIVVKWMRFVQALA